MLSFARPEVLVFTPLALLLAWWLVRRPRSALRYSDVRLVRGIVQRRAWLARWGPAVLRSLALLLLLLAIANPRQPDQLTRLPAEGIAIVVLVDVSGSMATPDFPEQASTISRLEAARKALTLFIRGGEMAEGPAFEGRVDDRIGLVSFAAVPRTECPLTLNHGVLMEVLERLRPREGVDAGTNLGDAIAEGLIRLETAGSQRRVLILLSDGEHNIAREGQNAPLQPRQAAQLAANLGIPIYAIDCGGIPAAGENPMMVEQREAGREVLSAVAELTGGRQFVADSAEQLREVYQEIDTLERRPAESFRYRRYQEYGFWLGLAGFVMLTLVSLLEMTLWRRLPVN